MVFRANVETIPYSNFLTLLDQGEIEKLAISESTLRGTTKNPFKGKIKEFITVRLPDPNLPAKLEAAHVPQFEAIPESSFFHDLLSWIVPAAVMIGLWWLLISRAGMQSRTDFLSKIGRAHV